MRTDYAVRATGRAQGAVCSVSAHISADNVIPFAIGNRGGCGRAFISGRARLACVVRRHLISGPKLSRVTVNFSDTVILRCRSRAGPLIGWTLDKCGCVAGRNSIFAHPVSCLVRYACAVCVVGLHCVSGGAIYFAIVFIVMVGRRVSGDGVTGRTRHHVRGRRRVPKIYRMRR